MATSSGQTPGSSQSKSSGYRIKFNREEFLKLLDEAKPRRLYRLKDFIYFAYDGFVMYCEELNDKDLSAYKVFDAIEFSNISWKKTKGMWT